MIYLASSLVSYQVISLSSLQSTGRVSGLLVDPYRFSVVGFWVEVVKRLQPRAALPLLLSQSIRQIDHDRLFINDAEDLNAPADLPKLKSILKIDYQIPGARIVSTDKDYLGRAEDFSFDEEDFKIMHLIVKPPLVQRLKTRQQRFHRNQVEKVGRRTIEVRVGLQTQRHQSVSTEPAA